MYKTKQQQKIPTHQDTIITDLNTYIMLFMPAFYSIQGYTAHSALLDLNTFQ